LLKGNSKKISIQVSRTNLFKSNVTINILNEPYGIKISSTVSPFGRLGYAYAV
jgi:hypothetical protein